MSSNVYGFNNGSMSNVYGFNNAIPVSMASGNYVTIDTTQTITGAKTFNSLAFFANSVNITGPLTSTSTIHADGNIETLATLRGQTLDIIYGGINLYTISPAVTAYIVAQSAGKNLAVGTRVGAGDLYLIAQDTTGVIIDSNSIRNYLPTIFNVDNSGITANISANQAAGAFNPSTRNSDNVVSASPQNGGVLQLTAYSTTTTGLRIEPQQVTLGAGGNSTLATSYIQINNGTNATCVGPVIASSDNSTKIATTQWVQSVVSSLATNNTVVFLYSPNTISLPVGSTYSITVQPPNGFRSCYFVLQGGGGGGGTGYLTSNHYGPNGGAGGCLQTKTYQWDTEDASNIPISFDIVVGGGGAKAPNSSEGSGSNGLNSTVSAYSITTLLDTYTAGGGGGGTISAGHIQIGGSGGGIAGATYAWSQIGNAGASNGGSTQNPNAYNTVNIVTGLGGLGGNLNQTFGGNTNGVGGFIKMVCTTY